MPQKRQFHFLAIACAIQGESATQLGIPESPNDEFKTNGLGVFNNVKENSNEPRELTAQLLKFMAPQDETKIRYFDRGIHPLCIKMLDFKFPELKNIAFPSISANLSNDERMIKRQKWAEEYSKEHQLLGKDVWIEIDTLENELEQNPAFIKKMSISKNSNDMTKLIDNHQNTWMPMPSNTIGGYHFGAS